MTVTAYTRDGTVTGRLDAWDGRSVTIDGRRYRGPVCVVAGGAS